MSNDNAGSNPFNRWWWIALGAVVIVAVLLALILTGVLGPREAAPTPEPTGSRSAPPPASGEPTSAPGADACALPDADQSIPVVGPDATWETNIYFLYPTSSAFGPTPNPASDAWGCFAHTPTGALFAVANAVNAIASNDRVSIMSDVAIANPSLDAWIAEQTPVGQTAGRVAQIVGYQFQSVDADKAVVRVGLEQQSTKVFMTVAVVWDDTTSNWRADFSQSNFAPTVDTLNGFTSWSAAE